MFFHKVELVSRKIMVVFNFAAFDYLEFLVFLSQNCSGPSESDAEDFSRRPFYGAP